MTPGDAYMQAVTRLCKGCGGRIVKTPGPGRWPKKCAACRAKKEEGPKPLAEHPYFAALRDAIRGA